MNNVSILIEKMRSYYTTHGRDDKFISWENKIVTKSPYTILAIAPKLNDIIDVKKFTDAIIATKDYRNIIEFAVNVRGANINKLTDAIIKSNDPFYIYQFATEIKHANYEKLEKAFINLFIDPTISLEYDAYRYIFEFLRTLKNANISKFVDVIITKFNNMTYDFAVEFKSRLTKDDIEKLSKAILSLDTSKCSDYMTDIIKFAKEFKPDNLDAYTDKVIATNDSFKILCAIENAPCLDYDRLSNAFFDSNPACTHILEYAKIAKPEYISRCNNEFISRIKRYVANDWKGFINNESNLIRKFGDNIFDYAMHVEGADIEGLEDILISFATAEQIFRFLTLVKGANRDKLVNAILSPKTEEEFDSSKFSIICSIATEVEGVDLDVLNEAYIKEVEKYLPSIDGSADFLERKMLSNNIKFYAQHVESADIEKLTELMLKIGRGDNLVEFAKKVPNCDVRKIVNFVFNAGFPPHIYECRGLVDDEEIIDVLTSPHVIKKYNTAMYLFEFAKCGIQLDRMVEAIIATNSIHYIEKCYNFRDLSEKAKKKLDKYMGIQNEKQEVEDLDNLVDHL